MRADETPTEGLKTHRPLPSIGIPLLRDERRAVRAKQVVWGVAVVAALGGSAATALVLPRLLGEPDDDGQRGDPVPGVPVAGAAPTEPVALLEDAGPLAPAPLSAQAVDLPVPRDDETPTHPDARTRTSRAFGAAGGFRDALEAAGSRREEALAVIASLEGVMDFRRCHAEDLLAFERDEAGSLVRFEYTAGPTQVFESVRGADGKLTGRRVEVPIERVRVARGGHVAGSLGDALDALGLGRSLVGAFVEVFEGRIDFASDTRAGDSFRIIVDEEHVGGSFLRYGTIHALEYTGQRLPAPAQATARRGAPVSGTLRAFWYEGGEEEGDFFDETGRAMHGGWLRTPLRYDHLSSPFDPRRMHPVLHRIMPHNGLDYAASPGTPVWAAASGVVTFAGERGANGNLVAIRHEGGFESFYAHLLRITPGIRPGVEVRQRASIGQVGSTGRSTGPHLHFGLKHHGRFVDPARELNGPGRMLAAGPLAIFRRQVRAALTELARIALAPAPSAAPSPPPPPPPEPIEGEEDVDIGG